MTTFLWVCAGGAVGSGARYALAGWLQKTAGSSFPVGTLAVNVIGSFLLATLVVVGMESDALSPTLRTALTVGVMGGFTTYSTFNQETLSLLRDGAWALAGANLAVTLVGCLAAGLLGLAAGRWIIGA